MPDDIINRKYDVVGDPGALPISTCPPKAHKIVGYDPLILGYTSTPNNLPFQGLRQGNHIKGLKLQRTPGVWIVSCRV